MVKFKTHLRGAINGGTPKWLVLKGLNPIKMDVLGVPPFQETTIWSSFASAFSPLLTILVWIYPFHFARPAACSAVILGTWRQPLPGEPWPSWPLKSPPLYPPWLWVSHFSPASRSPDCSHFNPFKLDSGTATGACQGGKNMKKIPHYPISIDHENWCSQCSQPAAQLVREWLGTLQSRVYSISLDVVAGESYFHLFFQLCSRFFKQQINTFRILQVPLMINDG